MMASPDEEPGRAKNEGPRHKVTIAREFAVSVFDVTFDEWDACVSVGGCREVGDSGFGRGTRPATNVTWDDAQAYVAWLSRMTGGAYRLPTEAEWEYITRAGTTTTYYWGNELGKGNANCIVCGTEWDNSKTSPVGSFKPNPFALYDVTGNAWQWLQDCFHRNYEEAPTDGSGVDQRRLQSPSGPWRFVDQQRLEPSHSLPRQLPRWQPKLQSRHPGREDAYALITYRPATASLAGITHTTYSGEPC